MSTLSFSVQLTSTLDSGVDEMFDALVRKLGAGTLTEGRGAWTNSQGEVIVERSCTFTYIYFGDEPYEWEIKLLSAGQLLDALFRWHQQEAIVFTLYGVTPHPTHLLVQTGDLARTLLEYTTV